MKKEKATTKWIACMLSLFTFFVLFSVNALSDSNNINANLVVIPTEQAFCFPQNLIVKEMLGNISCFIEVVSADPNIINVPSLRLGIVENSSAGIPPVTGSVSYINDFNNNGIKDIFVQFDFSKFKNFFSGLTLPGNYHYKISGNINITPFAFTQTSNVFAKYNVPAAQYTSLIDYTTSFEGNGGKIVVANNFPISKYKPAYNVFNGYFVQRVNYPNEKVISWGNPTFASQGTITIDFIVFKWILGQSLTVVPDGLVSCSSTTNSITICQGSGRMIMQGDWYFASNGNIPVKTIIYIISPAATKIFGFDSNNNKMLEIENINLKTLAVTQNISP